MTLTTDARRVAVRFTLADRMRKSLDSSGWGVQEAADIFGVTRNTVGNWINGRIEPELSKLRFWAVCFSVPLEWIVAGSWPDDWEGWDVGFAEFHQLAVAAGARHGTYEQWEEWCARRDSNPQPSDP